MKYIHFLIPEISSLKSKYFYTGFEPTECNTLPENANIINTD